MSKPKHFVKFKEIINPHRKTKMWVVLTTDETTQLGRVSWYSAWRRYTFQPSIYLQSAPIFDANCLREIADFMEGETTKHYRDIKIKRYIAGYKTELNVERGLE